MVFITEELVRKRSEHNEKQIGTLEELSLHQCDVEKIEHLDRWCKDLRILYLQGNLISKIEHLSRLKKLEYLNLALNSIERVENLQGCESLNKLDLTVNFVGEIFSLASLQHNEALRDLFLTGNPCSDFDGYREWVVVTLPQLSSLDGVEVTHSERIRARQVLSTVTDGLRQQQARHLEKRRKQTLAEETNKPPINLSELSEDERQKFWGETTPFTPESRRELHRHLEASRAVPESNKPEPWEVPARTSRLFNDQGLALNVNPAGLQFRLTDDEEAHNLVLDLAVYKYLDTSLLVVDVQPCHVTVHVKGRPFQLVLPEEVKPDSSAAQRSQTTGHLVVTMPKFSERRHQSAKSKLKPAISNVQKQAKKPESPPLHEDSDVPPLI